MKKLLMIMLLCSCSPKLVSTEKLKAREATKAKDRQTLKTTIVMCAIGFLLFKTVIPFDEFDN